MSDPQPAAPLLGEGPREKFASNVCAAHDVDWCEVCMTDAAARSPQPPAPEPEQGRESLRIQHARKQGGADGFQQGWHAALARVRVGDTPLNELDQLVPVFIPTVPFDLHRFQVAEDALALQAQELDAITELCREAGMTDQSRAVDYLKGVFYMLRKALPPTPERGPT